MTTTMFKFIYVRKSLIQCFAVWGLWSSAGTVLGAANQSQDINLVAGWNAVWLELDPTGENGAPVPVEAVFDHPAVTVVARPLNPVGTAEFISDPDRLFNQPGWAVWYRNPESGENTLINTVGYTAYLVYVDPALPGSADVKLTLSGEARFFRPNWKAGSYNLYGFNLLAPVRFDDFFGAEGEGDGSHPVGLIFRMMSDGNWTGVQSSDLMQPGEAFWIFAEDASEFMGPVSVAFDGSRSLDFGKGPGTLEVADDNGGTRLLTRREITFSNTDVREHGVVIREAEAAAGGALQIHQIVPVTNELGYEIGPNGEIDGWNIGPVGRLASHTVTLGVRRNWTDGEAQRENLYRIEVGSQFFYLPMTAEQPGLVGGSLVGDSAAATGLWLGTVVFDEVTQLGDGTPTSTTSTTPMRILVHVDGDGGASLLSQVILMQEKSAAPEADLVQVLVVDPSKLSNYEGIEERDGKLIGLRISTVGYDMPRDMNPETQASIRDEVADSIGEDPENVTSDQILTWVDGQAERPVGLAEEYVFSWPMSGGLGSGQSLTTTSELVLDPYHRSNPFRHAFHPQHGTGFAVSRSLSISIDTTNETDLFTGTYQETLTGLADQPVAVQGRLTLQRISTVDTLQ